MTKESPISRIKLRETMKLLSKSDRIISLERMMILCDCLDPKTVIDTLCKNDIFYSPDFGFFGTKVDPKLKEQAETVLRKDYDESAWVANNELARKKRSVNADDTYGIGTKSGKIRLPRLNR